jgi:soluble lytic murein transglycosylase-like protein
MPQVPTRRDLGQLRINGRANPADINPNVALDIGRAGAAYKHAFDQIGAAFAGLGEKQQAMEDANWLADAKIQSLTADDQIRRDTELNAGEDGTGFEQAPLRLDQATKEIEAKPGGSGEARAKFKLWSAERHFETGRWAANTAQKRLQDSTGSALDKRLDEMTNLSSANPDQANDYFKAYEDEVNSRVGSAITAQDGAQRIEQARTNILKSATISKAIKNPADFGKAVQAIESGRSAMQEAEPPSGGNSSLVDAVIQAESSGRAGIVSPKGAVGLMQVMPDTARELAPKVDPDAVGLNDNELKAYLKNPDVNRKFGEAYLNQMLERYRGDKEAALIAYNGGPSRADAWLKAGRDDKAIPQETANYYKNVLGQMGGESGVGPQAQTKSFTGAPTGASEAARAGITPRYNQASRLGLSSEDLTTVQTSSGAKFTVASPAAKQYQGFLNELEGMGYHIDAKQSGGFADRNIAGTNRPSQHASGAAIDINWNRNKNDQKGTNDLPPNIGEIANRWGLSWGGYFSGRNKDTMHFEVARVLSGNEVSSVQPSRAPVASAPQQQGRTEAERSRFDISKIPAIEGSSIQPQELLSLSPKDYHAVVSEMRPYLIADTTSRMEKALSSLSAKGTQSIIKPEEIDNMTPFVGAKTAQAWKDQLSEGAQTYSAAQEVKAMTPEQRYQRLTELVPTGRVEDLSEQEAKRFEIYSKAVQGVNSAIKKDPYGYFTIENESGRQAAKLLAGAQQGPEGTPAREQAFDTLIRLQKQEGIAPSDIKILSPTQAQGITTMLKDAKTGPAAMVIINGLRQTYGKHFNQLWGEMVDNGAPQSYLALKTATRAGQDALVESYALEKAMDEGGAKGGRKGLLLERAGIKPTELSAAVSNEISDFTQAIQHKSGSARAIESYRSATERVAAYYVISQGKSVSDAASQAAKELFGNNLKVVQGALVPTEVYDRMGGEINRTLANDIPKLLENKEEMIVAPVRSGSGIYTPDHERQRYIDSIRTNPKFVTNEDASGVYLLDKNGDYVLEDTANGPAPISWTWEELAKAPRPAGYSQSLMFR